MEELSPLRKDKFIALQDEGKALAAEGFLEESLAKFKQARAICETKKVSSRIKRLEDILKTQNVEEEEEDNDEMITIAEGFQVYKEINKKLYDYQKDGVAWMWKLFKAGKGGVLGDDMGLGKTFQVIAFLSGMIDANLIKHMLIIMPVSLLPNWQNEFKKWCPGIMVLEYHGSSKKERERNLNRVQRRGGVLMTSYGMIAGNFELLSKLDGYNFVWDYVILDEGHKIKNATKTTKAVHEIPSKYRLVITGTPIQNNLRELWALYDFAHHGTLLGSQKTFKMQYETPITRAREKDSTAGERKLGTEMAQNLKDLIKPYFLRRTKAEVLEKKSPGDSAMDELGNQLGNMKLSALPKKNDLIIWTFLNDIQYELYTSFLESDAVKKMLVTTRSPLVELTILKKICDHPRLLSHKACLQLGLDGNISEENLMSIIEDETSMSPSITNVSDETLINESGKLNFALKLLENLRANGHRSLVFSLSLKILDMIQRILTKRGWKVMRIDGTITKMEERARRIKLFQSDPSWSVFLLTTQVGGVGITLTAADRVIIYDPSWNPATDAQAVDRAFRIGQKKEVVVYRLITCATVEEKIYRRQIFKDSITRQATSSHSDPHRYFSKQELRELFTIDDHRYSHTQVQLEDMHSQERKSDPHLNDHINFLRSLNIFGISDHDLMFSKDVKSPDEDNGDTAASNDYIRKRVEMAQMMVQREASVIADGMRQSGSYVKPFTLNVPSSNKKLMPDFYQQPTFPDITELNSGITFKAGGDSNIKMKQQSYSPNLPRITEQNVVQESTSGQISAAIHAKENKALISEVEKKLSYGSEASPGSGKELSPTQYQGVESAEVISSVGKSDHPDESYSELQVTNSVKGSPSPVKDKRVVEMRKFLNDSTDSLDASLCGNRSRTREGRPSRRKSCAMRKSTILLSDSESSKMTCPSVDASAELIVSESDELCGSSEDDDVKSSKISTFSGAVSCIQNSPVDILYNSAEMPKFSYKQKAVEQNISPFASPQKTNCVMSTPKKENSMCRLDSPNNLVYSPKRITPLRVLHDELTRYNKPFEEAMNASIEYSPTGTSKKRTSSTVSENVDESDSPVAVVGRRRNNLITSDSETSMVSETRASTESPNVSSYSIGLTFDNECREKLSVSNDSFDSNFNEERSTLHHQIKNLNEVVSSSTESDSDEDYQKRLEVRGKELYSYVSSDSSGSEHLESSTQGLDKSSQHSTLNETVEYSPSSSEESETDD